VFDHTNAVDVAELLETRGVDLTSANVVCESPSGLFAYAGRRTILYRRQRVASEQELNTAKPFHLVRCEALERLAHRVHAARHTYTVRRDGLFVMVVDTGDAALADVTIPLKPCRLCLAHLDYHGYAGATRTQKEAILEAFLIHEFLDAYPAVADTRVINETVTISSPNDYPAEWDLASRSLRQGADWTCSRCKVRCHSSKALLHTHHVNGIKADIRIENLRALCATCHRQEEGHGTMYVDPSQAISLDTLRREQGINTHVNQTGN